MMSPTAPESKLESLECHFTWDLDCSGSKLLRLRDKLEDIGTEEDNCWLGHIYNLQGFIQYKLDPTEDSQSFFNKAAEALCENRGAEEGPWLVVNYGDLAWLHHHLGDQAESQAYLSKVDALMKKYPPPSKDELHAEVYAEKAWTLVKLRGDTSLATCYFQRAFEMQPDRVEWFTSYVLVLASDARHSKTGPEDDIMEKMKSATEKDRENLHLAVVYLDQRARKGESVKEEAHELGREILRNPISRYSGVRALVRLYLKNQLIDEAIGFVKEALERHPNVRFLKRCLYLCYKPQIAQESERDTAIRLNEEVTSLYPHSYLLKIDLANHYAKSDDSLEKAEQMYQELLENDLEPADKQLVYNKYANHLYFVWGDNKRSLEYHMMAAEIPIMSFFRWNSRTILQNMKCRKVNKNF